MKSSIVAVLLLASSLFASDLDSLLTVQRGRAGVRADTLFSVLDQTSGSERTDAEFLLAYLPLADIAYMTGDDLLENVRLAEKAKAEMPWGGQLSPELYQHFVLPHRVSQEPFVHWRKQFYETLAPRVKNMTMTEAALEVNHWCHEVATYQPSDSRDQDPLTTIRAGLGRCEEEMILAICALRSVGIPARQCYTPFWPHMDDNHAWVEVWADGRWHYFGACEPDVALDHAWFTNAAKRAMLVVSTAYGDYQGPEPVLKRYGNSTLINSTSVYGATRNLDVQLLDAKGRPAAKQKVFFNLYNYGSFLPCLSLETDESGHVSIVSGPGDWFITAGDSQNATFAHLKGNVSQAMLRLGDLKALRKIGDQDYDPPPEAPPSLEGQRDSLFACRLTTEDSLRDARMWSTWAREAGVTPLVTKPDSAWVYAQTDTLLPDSSQHELLETLRKARGNWGNLWNFMFKLYPGEVSSDISRNETRLRLKFLSTLSEKDCRDMSGPYLAEESGLGPFVGREMDKMFPPDSVRVAAEKSHSEEEKANTGVRFEYTHMPRLSYEPSRPWRSALQPAIIQFGFRRPGGDVVQHYIDSVRSWLLSNITVEENKDRLGPPLTPAECLLLRRGAQDDLERLYLGFMRVNGVPARFNPVTMKPEIWEKGAWQRVELTKSKIENRKSKTPKTGKLVIAAASDSTIQAAQYNKMWGVAQWDKDHFSDLDFGYMEPFKNVKWPQDLPAGLYCLTTGIRRKDGSVPVSVTWFDIQPGKTTKVELKFRDNGDTATTK
jgi:transglutaminase-like putative cysteine protease